MVASSAEVKSEAKNKEKWLGAVVTAVPSPLQGGDQHDYLRSLILVHHLCCGRDCSDWGLGFVPPSKATTSPRAGSEGYRSTGNSNVGTPRVGVFPEATPETFCTVKVC